MFISRMPNDLIVPLNQRIGGDVLEAKSTAPTRPGLSRPRSNNSSIATNLKPTEPARDKAPRSIIEGHKFSILHLDINQTSRTQSDGIASCNSSREMRHRQQLAHSNGVQGSIVFQEHDLYAILDEEEDSGSNCTYSDESASSSTSAKVAAHLSNLKSRKAGIGAAPKTNNFVSTTTSNMVSV